MKKIALYFHGGSDNHGCEAIIRSTAKIINRELCLYSALPDKDKQYGLEKIIEIKADQERKLNKFEKIYTSIFHKINKDDYVYLINTHKSFFDEVNKGDIYISVGGDNYCYSGKDILGYYNKKLHARGAKTVLWGCSFEPDDLTEDIAKDLAMYDLIVAREKISYDILKTVNSNTILLPDPAFQLDRKVVALPCNFVPKKTIGVNISPLIANYADKELILENYRNLIRYIIYELNCFVAFIPHVVTDISDDRTILAQLFQEFEYTNKIILFADMNCEELKYVISNCRMFVAARTHASIAAYSSCVPTLVVGYSVKAVGIARELFDTDENYVLPVQKMVGDYNLVDKFKWLEKHENEVRNKLEKIIPIYINKLLDAETIVDNL